jgi:hypothetical protein
MAASTQHDQPSTPGLAVTQDITSRAAHRRHLVELPHPSPPSPHDGAHQHAKDDAMSKALVP